MSLLITRLDENMEKVARDVYDRHFEKDEKLNREYDSRRKRLMYEDIIYNLGYLDTALYLKDDKIMSSYALWIYRLLCHLMKDISPERIKEQMVTHYTLLKESVAGVLKDENKKNAIKYLDHAITETENSDFSDYEDIFLPSGEYADVKEKYLSLLLDNKSREAIEYIVSAGEKMPVETLYDDVLKNVMYRVGDLWYKNKITVDKEHFCTSTTQVAISQFYPRIFSSSRNNKTIVTCCIGSELHEMGVRMLSDLFENSGWDSFYLGSAVPLKAILQAIENYRPEIIGLSVTMPQHLKECHESVNAIREKYGDKIKILVGGRAFEMTDRVWEKWPVDLYTKSAKEAVEWAGRN